MTRRVLAAFVSLVVLQAGCADEEPAGCREGNMVGGVCAGVPNDAVCEEDYCTQGVSCSSVIEVDSGEAFAAAVGRAQAGTCIALAPGSYGSVILPPGVSLLGRGADFVTVGGVETSGDDVFVRGLTIQSGSLNVRSGSTTASMVRILDSLQDGVTAGSGSNVSINASEIRNAERYGVSGFDIASLVIEDSVVEGRAGHGGPGVWAQCNLGCACANRPQVSMTNVKISLMRIIALSLVAADATLHNVELRNTAVGDGFEHGGGVAASECAGLTATDLRIIDNEDYGMLIHDSSLNADGLKVSGNLRGVWIQAVGASMPGSVYLRNGELTGNQGVGIGVAMDSKSVTIENTNIADTQQIALPVMIDGVSASSELVANGITWKGLSHLSLNGVTVRSSQKQSVLIDGGVASGSTIANVLLSEGDETKGILQQNFMEGMDQSPQVIDSPPLTVTPEELFGVPDDIIPPTILTGSG
ncbi:MAG TPA: right-handed parallel beta-helix repeat-containing protein [Polyangiaceae bacterium]|jgi:hypothetical protein|nr:right-handed parallel beta-helix repeat-containing protein [Polyangiaceae bacterium]